jgi:hypothetical protein
MSSQPPTADDLLQLCSRVHGAAGALEATPPLPRVETLQRLARFTTERMTRAALAHERGDDETAAEALGESAAALCLAEELAGIGVDEHGFVGRESRSDAIVPTPAERTSHAAYLEAVSGVVPALSVIIEEIAGDMPGMPQVPDVTETADLMDALVDECTAELRRADHHPPADPADYEPGMVWMTFCRLVLERALSVLDALESDAGGGATAGLNTIARLPAAHRALGLAAESDELLELAAGARSATES